MLRELLTFRKSEFLIIPLKNRVIKKRGGKPPLLYR